MIKFYIFAITFTSVEWFYWNLDVDTSSISKIFKSDKIFKETKLLKYKTRPTSNPPAVSSCAKSRVRRTCRALEIIDVIIRCLENVLFVCLFYVS